MGIEPADRRLVARRDVRPVDVERGPGRVEAARLPRRDPHDVLAARVRPDADEDPLGGRPRPLDRALAQEGQHLVVDMGRGPAQRQLAQRRQVPTA